MSNATALMRNAGLLSLATAIERRGPVPKGMQASARGAHPDVRTLFGLWPGLGAFVQYERKGYSIVLPLRLVIVEALLREAKPSEVQAVCRLFGIPKWYAEDFTVALRQARIKQRKSPAHAYLFDAQEISDLRTALERLHTFANAAPDYAKVRADAPEHALGLYRKGELSVEAATVVCGFDPSATVYAPPFPVVPARAPALLAPAVFYIEAPPDAVEHTPPTQVQTAKGVYRRRYSKSDPESTTPAPPIVPGADEFDGFSTTEVYPGDVRPMGPQRRPKRGDALTPAQQASYAAQEDAAALEGLEPVYEAPEPQAHPQAAYTPPGPRQPSPATPSPGRAQAPTQPAQTAPLDLSTLAPEYADLGAKLLQNIMRQMANATSASEIKDLSVALKNVTGCVRGIPGIPNELASALRPAESPDGAIADDAEPLPQDAQAGGGGMLDDEARLLGILAGGSR